jgi:uncharacterized protein YbjT (DUF2867 family)
MEILVLGGTRFHMVRELLYKGHQVTIATRVKLRMSLEIGSI